MLVQTCKKEKNYTKLAKERVTVLSVYVNVCRGIYIHTFYFCVNLHLLYIHNYIPTHILYSLLWIQYICTRFGTSMLSFVLDMDVRVGIAKEWLHSNAGKKIWIHTYVHISLGCIQYYRQNTDNMTMVYFVTS